MSSGAYWIDPMILLMIEWLAHLGYKSPAAFSYTSTRMILAAITTLCCTIFLGPFCIRKLYALKTGQSIRVDDCLVLKELHKKKRETPSMGGVLITFSILLALFLWSDWRSSFTLILFLTMVWFAFVGGWDDYLKMKRKSARGLSGKRKLALQVAFAALLGLYLLVPSVSESIHVGKWFAPPVAKEVVAGGGAVTLSTHAYQALYYLPFLKEPLFTLHGAWVGIAFALILFVVVGSTNAVNLTDGLDGLAAGCTLMVAGVLALVAFLSNHIAIAEYLNILYIEGSSEVAVLLAALMGASLGFLWYNGYPAQVFMGDTGSLALGGIVGVSAVLLRREFLLALIGGIFALEALSVILQVGSYRLRGKKRIFLCAPLHHHFECKGWPETKVVLRFWIIGLLLALLGVASFKFQ